MKRTARAGSEPVWKMLLSPLMNERGAVGEEEKDAKSESSTDKDEKADSSAVPWDKDPRWKEWREQEKSMKALLEDSGVESLEELKGILEESGELKGKLADVDLDSLFTKAETLDKYEEYWAAQDAKKKEDEEDPTETIRRLESEKRELQRERETDKNRQTEYDDAARAVKAYEKEVKSAAGDLSKDEFVMEYFGVGNKANDIDITDAKAVKRLVEEGIEKKKVYDQKVIKAYLDGKIELPKIPSGDTGTTKQTEVKTMKEARQALKDQVGKIFGG